MTDVRRPQRNNRLSWFLSMIIIASIILPALIVGVMEITVSFRTEINNRSQKQASALIEVLKKGLNPPLWSFIPENAEHLIDGVALNESISKITVYDSEGSLFVEYMRNNYAVEKDAIRLSADVTREQEVIGKIELEFSLAQAKTQAWHDTQRILFITVAQIIFSLSVILIIINRRVSRPLYQLKAFAYHIASKNFSASIQTNYDDEFADLARELDAMREALKESFENLEDRVASRTKDLTSVNKELTSTVNRLEEAKDNLVQTEKLAALGSLVAGVSHELNTPIGNGRVMSSSLHQTATHLQSLFKSGSMTKSQFESGLLEIVQGANLIERNLQKAVNLVQSFKKIAVDRTSDNRRIFQLNEFIEEIESTMRHLFKATPFKFLVTLSDDVELDSYPGVLSQVITNLINNALMHGLDQQPQGCVEVSTVVSEHKVTIRVTDDGLGMTKETQRRIFEPFFTTKMGKGGSGLGMHIVHNLTTASLGGQLNVDSELNLGTRIEVTIPLKVP